MAKQVVNQAQVKTTILGSAQITTGTSTTSTTFVQVSGLTSTVTIPSGGRSVRVSFYANSLYTQGTAPMGTFVSIWDGTVGSGTELQEWSMAQNTTSGLAASASLFAIATPAAGSKTYNVGLRTQTSGGTSFLQAASNYPAILLVELI